MSRGRRRQVYAGSLQTPERGMALATPEDESPLLSRLDAARELQPPGDHWPAPWIEGRDWAIEQLEAGRPANQVRSAHVPQGPACRDCWSRGRDAVIGLMS